MQSGLTRTDRRLVIGAALLAVLLIVAAATIGGGLEREESPVPSSYSSDSGGALAAYLLLTELDRPVQRWEQPPGMLPASAQMLVIAEPTEAPGQGEDKALAAFVTRGGRILFCGAALPSFLGAPSLVPVRASDWRRFSAELPSQFTRSAGQIVMKPEARWELPGPSHLRLYGDDDGGVVVTWKLGAGEVLWWASATPLTNAGITRDGNLQLFLNAVSSPDGRPLNVYWDEYFHGRHGTLWSYVRETPVKWALLQTGLLSIAILFTFSRRSGPVVPPPVLSRLSPLEFVETMGGLYQRAGAASIAVDTSYRHLRLELARRLRFPSDARDDVLARAAEQRIGAPAELASILAAAAQARELAQLPPKRALELVQKLEEYLKQLTAPKGLFSPPQAPPQQKRN